MRQRFFIRPNRHVGYCTIRFCTATKSYVYALRSSFEFAHSQYNIRTFIQTPAQNQNDPNFMRSVVIHFGEKISVGIILFRCTS